MYFHEKQVVLHIVKFEKSIDEKRKEETYMMKVIFRWTLNVPQNTFVLGVHSSYFDVLSMYDDLFNE